MQNDEELPGNGPEKCRMTKSFHQEMDLKNVE
jgi:hypothetical protein